MNVRRSFGVDDIVHFPQFVYAASVSARLSTGTELLLQSTRTVGDPHFLLTVDTRTCVVNVSELHRVELARHGGCKCVQRAGVLSQRCRMRF